MHPHPPFSELLRGPWDAVVSEQSSFSQTGCSKLSLGSQKSLARRYHPPWDLPHGAVTFGVPAPRLETRHTTSDPGMTLPYQKRPASRAGGVGGLTAAGNLAPSCKTHVPQIREWGAELKKKWGESLSPFAIPCQAGFPRWVLHFGVN